MFFRDVFSSTVPSVIEMFHRSHSGSGSVFMPVANPRVRVNARLLMSATTGERVHRGSQTECAIHACVTGDERSTPTRYTRVVRRRRRRLSIKGPACGH